jgi:hypothetical protein
MKEFSTFLNMIPILIISVLILYQPEAARFSHTILGKLCAIVLILGYTYIDVLYGVLCCACVILYYQSDYVEGFSDFRATFVAQNCAKGQLMHKGVQVKTEMADHVFPELEFSRGEKCNPCLETCDFSIIEEKLKTESELVTPKDSNDWTWTDFTGSMAKYIPALYVKSEPFATRM